MDKTPLQSTPLPIIAEVSRIVTSVADRLTGDRGDYPLLVAAATADALKFYQIAAQVIYGPAAWIEILENQTPIWAGCWNGNFHFWATTPYGEVIDLNTSVAYRKKPQSPVYQLEKESVYSPPILWSKEVPKFYRYQIEGVAELELHEDTEKKKYEQITSQVREALRPLDQIQNLTEESLQFPNEPILCPGRKLLDDSKQTFKLFDRALSVYGIPPCPF